MIIGIKGLPEQGKTASAVFLAYIFREKYSIIASNMKRLQFGNAFYPDPLELVNNLTKNQKVLYIWDEAYSAMDSRSSMSIDNRLMSYLTLQLRKFHVDMIHIEQLRGSVDIRLRDISKFYIHVQKLGYIPNDSLIVKWYIFDELTILSDSPIAELKVRIPQRILNMYDTYEITESQYEQIKELKEKKSKKKSA